MKISYLTLYDARDIHKWSGSGYFISRTLEKEGAVLDYIGNIQVQPGKLARLKKLSYRMIQKKYNHQRTISFAREFAQRASELIRPESDIVFSPGSIALSLLKTRKPKVFYTDATFAGMINFYENYTGLTGDIIEQGHIIDQMALDSSAMAFYSSEWAAKTAIDFYKVNPEKIRVVPFGANIEKELSYQEVKTMVSGRSSAVCNLLFAGVDWYRKGGDVALRVAGELNSRGLNTTLHVVGIRNLDLPGLPSYVVNHGFISKSTDEGKKKLEELFAACHFLILPSRAEAYGLVLCEASSYGLPSLASDVGGIPTVIREGFNGRTFGADNDENDYADYIMHYFHHLGEYEQLCYSSYNEYKMRLNWDVAGKSLMKHLRDL